MAVVLSAAAGFILTHSLLAKEPNEKALLWKIEGKDIQPSYLYGTFHLIDKADFRLSSATEKAFGETENLVLELDFDDPNLKQKMAALSPMKNGTTISSLLNEKEQKVINESLTNLYGIDLKAVDQMKPFLVSSMLLPMVLEGEVASYENTFVQMAKSQQKEILGLETPEEQMRIFDKISYQSQADGLVEMVLEVEKMKGIFSNMVKYYHDEDLEGLLSIFDDYYEDAEEKNMLLKNRNEIWQTRIPSIAAKKSTFFAVGAGHLGGKFGIINLLKEKGYTVTPVL